MMSSITKIGFFNHSGSFSTISQQVSKQKTDKWSTPHHLHTSKKQVWSRLKKINNNFISLFQCVKFCKRDTCEVFKWDRKHQTTLVFPGSKYATLLVGHSRICQVLLLVERSFKSDWKHKKHLCACGAPTLCKHATLSAFVRNIPKLSLIWVWLSEIYLVLYIHSNFTITIAY